MKAVVHRRYGPPSALSLEDVPAPLPGRGEVLVDVHATGVNASDWEYLTGSPAYTRLWGLRRPRRTILGSDVAGRVAAVGADVDGLRVGDPVFGDLLGRGGGFAEQVLAPAGSLAVVPEGLSFVEAAALPQPGGVALQGLEAVGAGPGTSLLINGAGGGAGTMAVQLARRAGARVTAVDAAAKHALLRALGADAVLDYAAVDFTRTGERWDGILDLVLTRPVPDLARALEPGGRLVAVGGTVPRLLGVLTRGTWRSWTTDASFSILAHEPRVADHERLAALVRAGELRAAVERTYPLDAVRDALRHVGEGRALGKVVVEVRGC